MVKSVPAATAGSLQAGDILISEAQTGLAIDGPESLDAMLADLVSEGQAEAQLNVLRNGTEADATMQLTQE